MSRWLAISPCIQMVRTEHLPFNRGVLTFFMFPVVSVITSSSDSSKLLASPTPGLFPFGNKLYIQAAALERSPFAPASVHC